MTFRKTPQEKAKLQPSVMYGRCVGGSSVHFTANFWRFHEIDFIERSKVGEIPGAAFADWPITLRGPGALLHESGMGSGRFRSGRRQPVRSAAVEAVSDAAAAGERFGRGLRARRAETRLSPVSRADGDSFAAASGAQRLRELRILSGFWLRSRREVQFAVQR